MVFLANASVTLTCAANPSKTLTVSVKMYPAARDAHIYPMATDYAWGVKIPSTLIYAAGFPVGQSDTITWTNPRGIEHSGNLQFGGETLGMLAQRTFFFNEMSPGA